VGIIVAKGGCVTLHHLETVVRPRTLQEAWEERVKAGDRGRFLAGGIDLVLSAPPTVQTLIDLSALGLLGIRRDGDDLVIGAMTTLSGVLESASVAEVCGGFLVEVLHRVASPLQRNLATIGGAVARAHSWSDVVPALLVLDARLDVFDGRESRVRLVDYYDVRAEGPGPLLTAVVIPADAKGSAAFEKFARTAFDVGALNCACFVSETDEADDPVRVAVGGTPALARRLPGAEGIVREQGLTVAGIGGAARAAAEEIDARDDRRATAAYRRVLAEVGVRRCLERIVRYREAR
jgi:carbon-monoxide dehydrogenase medium subunit